MKADKFLMNFYVEKNLYKDVKVISIKKERTMTSILNELLEGYVKNNEELI